MKTTADAEGYKTLSTKYATVYPYNTSDDSNVNNWATYKNLNYGYGDAILETSTAGNGSLSWNNNYSIFSNTKYPFFVRGGHFPSSSSAGIFAFSATYRWTIKSLWFPSSTYKQIESVIKISRILR